MSKLKKVLLMCTAYVLVAALAIGGTIAYLQDDDSDVNVMTLGNVSIAQHEYEREVDANGNYVTKTIDNVTSYVLKDFTQGKPLLPCTEDSNHGAGPHDDIPVRMSQVYSYGGAQVFKAENAQDKIVTVENTGKTDAYVRTIIALELGSLTINEFNNVVATSARITTDNADLSAPWFYEYVGIAEIDGNYYVLEQFTYHGARTSSGIKHANGVLPAGDTTYPSLMQVYMMDTATNEDCEKIDGNGNGTYDILVLSQAVQAAGFDNAQTALDTAFGKSSEKAAEWFGGVKIPEVIDSAEKLQDAFDSTPAGAGQVVVTLGGNITGDVTVPQKDGVDFIIDGNGKEYKGSLTIDGDSAAYESANLIIQNFIFNADTIDTDACINFGVSGDTSTRYASNVIIKNCIFDVPNKAGIQSYTGGDKNVTVVDCTATARARSLMQVPNVNNLVIDNCKVYSKNGVNLNQSENVTIVNCTFDVTGYAVRFGATAGRVGFAETYVINKCSLKSACDDGDAVIVLRATCDKATLTITETTITGSYEIDNTKSDATVVR